MKKKQTIAILLSVLLLTSVTLPGTWANEDPIDSENAETTPTPEDTDTDTEAESEEEPESESESETEEEPESESETQEPEPEPETEPETEEPETEPETTETEPETTAPEPEENPLYTSFNLLMEDESMDSKAKWDELRTLFALDDDMDVLTILNTIAQKLELQPDEFVKFFEQFRTIIETILDEIQNVVTDGDLQEKAQLLYEKIMSCTLIEDIWVAIESADPAVVEVMSEEQIDDIEAHVEENEPEPLPEIVIEESEPPVPSEIYTPTVNFANVAPLVGAE